MGGVNHANEYEELGTILDRETGSSITIPVKEGKLKKKNLYRSLEGILEEAVKQASEGKGKERHANEDEAFEEQLICLIGRLGCNYNNGQAVKKIIESIRLRKKNCDWGIFELLGAINYLASDIILLKEQKRKDKK